MDISKFDLQGLQMLHISLKSMLNNNETQLKERLSTGDISQMEEMALRFQIKNAELNISKVESRIRELNQEKLRFSIEYIFWNFGLQKKSFQVSFITTSNSYKVYGEYITGVALYDKDEIEELIKRAKSGSWEDGKIKFEEIVNDNMSEELKERLKIKGFLASEIDSISWA